MWQEHFSEKHRKHGLDCILYYPEYVPGTNLFKNQRSLTVKVYTKVTTTFTGKKHNKVLYLHITTF